MNKKSGFTLAEVLVTLMIIGVIAAMTIPSLMQSTAKQEYKAALKKAISTVNQAMALNYALAGVGAAEDASLEFLTNRLNISEGSDLSSGLYTADGIYYILSGTTLTVDVNGQKGPNSESEVGTPRDIYTLTLDTTRNIIKADSGSAAADALYNDHDTAGGSTSSTTSSGT